MPEQDMQEVVAALRNFVARGELSRYPAAPLLERIWQLRDRLTPYDAAYVCLAEALDIPLVTSDQRLARAGGHRADVVSFDG